MPGADGIRLNRLINVYRKLISIRLGKDENYSILKLKICLNVEKLRKWFNINKLQGIGRLFVFRSLRISHITPQT
jgi:hypothetical protein